MNYRVEFSGRARRYLKRLPRDTALQILNDIETIRSSPTSGKNIRALGGKWKGFHRLRAGQYRVIYKSYQETSTILVVKVGPRGDVYK